MAQELCYPATWTIKDSAIVNLVPALALQAGVDNHDGPPIEHSSSSSKTLSSALAVVDIEFVTRCATFFPVPIVIVICSTSKKTCC